MHHLKTNPLRLLIVGMITTFMVSACSDDSREEAKKKLKGDRISVLSYERSLRADPRLSGVPIVLPQPYENDGWHQPGAFADNVAHHLMINDETRKKFSVSFVSGSTNDLKMTATPVIAEDMIFGLGADMRLTAANAHTGKKIWTIKVYQKGAEIEDGFGGGISYWGGQIFVATGFGELLAVDAKTGRINWRETSAIPFKTSPTVDDGKVFIVSHDNQLQVFSTDDGSRIWTHLAIVEPATILSSPSPAVSGDIVVTGFSSGEVVSLRVANGTVNWEDMLSRAGQLTPLSDLNPIVGRPVIDRDRVFAASHGGRMVSIDLRTGERVWMAEVKSIETPWVAGDNLFLVTTDAKVICLSRGQGRIRWITQLQDYEDDDNKDDPVSWSGPVLAGDRLLLASSLGDFVSISPYTGEIVSLSDVGDPVSISPIVANKTVYVLTDKGRLIAYR